MSNPLRQFKRKKQREFNYQEYSQRVLARKLQQKKQAAMESMKDEWKKTVDACVPQWLLKVSKYIPPMWYLKITTKFSQILPSQKWVDVLLTKAKTGEMARWRVAMNVNIAMWWPAVWGTLLVRIPLWIRSKIVTIGLKTIIYEVRAGVLKMEISYFGKIVCEKEVSL